MITPKISILVPVYGTEKYIERCSRSLFNQSYDNIEFIFVDDCSKDKSIYILNEILGEYSNLNGKVKIIKHENNLGLGGARLTGLENASGDYVWFVDSDDYIDAHAIEDLVEYMNQGYDLITFSYYEVLEGNIKKHQVNQATVENLLTFKVFPSIWKNIIKRTLLLQNRIKPVVGIDYAEDLHLLFRLALVAEKKITLSDKYLYYYNISNNDSIMHNVKTRHLENYADACCIVKEYYNNKNAINAYSENLIYLLSDSLFKLSDRDKHNTRVEILKKEIRCIDYISYIILLIPVSYELKKRILLHYLSIKRWSHNNIFR